MPDNPHPHPPEFDQNVQWFAIALLKLVRERMTSITNMSVPSDPKYNSRYFVIEPRT
jgi:hypothetical protein